MIDLCYGLRVEEDGVEVRWKERKRMPVETAAEKSKTEPSDDPRTVW